MSLDDRVGSIPFVGQGQFDGFKKILVHKVLLSFK
jgi:hypothetical protein